MGQKGGQMWQKGAKWGKRVNMGHNGPNCSQTELNIQKQPTGAKRVQDKPLYYNYLELNSYQPFIL
jgi:hypothetical protein